MVFNTPDFKSNSILKLSLERTSIESDLLVAIVPSETMLFEKPPF